MWILLAAQFCLLFIIKVGSGSECCLTRTTGKLYCAEGEYCCQRGRWPDGSNLYCCDSYYDRAKSIYVDNCYTYSFPVYGIVLIVFGLFFAIVTSIALYCCCRKSRGFRGTVNSTAPVAVIPQGVNGTSYPGSPPPYPATTGIPGTQPYDKPPPYSAVMAADTSHR